MDAKYLEAHRALEKKIAAAEADARKLLASGAKVEAVVKHLGASRTILNYRAGDIAHHLEKAEAEAKAKAEAEAKAKAAAEKNPPPPTN